MKKLMSIPICLIVLFAVALPVTASTTDSINKINLTIDSCNVRVEVSENSQFEYLYDEKAYSLTTTAVDDILKINIASAGDTHGLTEMVIVKIPAKDYDEIVVHGTKSGISLPAGINADFEILGDSCAISIGVMKGFTKSIDLTCNSGSGAMAFYDGAADYTLTINPKASAISTPFSNFIPNQQFIYSDGSGEAKITLNIEESSFGISTVHQ